MTDWRTYKITDRYNPDEYTIRYSLDDYVAYKNDRLQRIDVWKNLFTTEFQGLI